MHTSFLVSESEFAHKRYLKQFAIILYDKDKMLKRGDGWSWPDDDATISYFDNI